MPGDACFPIRTGITNRLILDQIADKWSILILAVLCQQPRRFNEIRRALDSVTQKALTQCLRRLERNGLVSRRIIAGSPVGVEYAITPLGASLKEPIRALHAWTLDHEAAILTAQRNYDAAQGVFSEAAE
jgi:DNA-binding HxlR family transcriptional regulator